MLNFWLLGCACICSSRIVKPLGGKSNLEGNNGIPGSFFYLIQCRTPIGNAPTGIAFMPKI